MHDTHDHDNDHGHDHEHDERGPGAAATREEVEQEMIEVLSVELERLKKLPYSKLTLYMGAGNANAYDTPAKSGTPYDVEVESVWEDAPDGNLRVNVAVFEKSWTSFMPMMGTFVITPEGAMIGDVKGEG